MWMPLLENPRKERTLWGRGIWMESRGKKESHRFLTCRSQDGNHWLYKQDYRLRITRVKPFMHEIINRRRALSKEMRVRVCLWVWVKQFLFPPLNLCLKKAIYSPSKEREKKEGERLNERGSTTVMQLRGSYQKRSKQERLKGLDFKKPLIAAKRNEPGSPSGMD